MPNSEWTGSKSGMKVLTIFYKIRHQWWFIALIMIFGGLIGLAISMLRPPLYEATSIFSVSIDYTQTGALTDIQEDQIMRNIGYILTSEKVMQATWEKIKDIGCIMSRENLADLSFLDRQDASWYLRIRTSDPDCAMKMVNTWSAIADEVLQEGLFHAVIVDANNHLLAKLKNCLIDFDTMQQPAYCCGFNTIDEVQDQINEVGSIIMTERQLSEGLMPAISIHLVTLAKIPNDPVQHNRNMLVLSGLVAGFFLSMFFLAVQSESRDK
jgi:hypothetical protein